MVRCVWRTNVEKRDGGAVWRSSLGAAAGGSSSTEDFCREGAGDGQASPNPMSGLPCPHMEFNERFARAQLYVKFAHLASGPPPRGLSNSRKSPGLDFVGGAGARQASPNPMSGPASHVRSRRVGAPKPQICGILDPETSFWAAKPHFGLREAPPPKESL